MENHTDMAFSAKQELLLEKGWMNHAGTLGFSPPAQYWQEKPPLAYVTPPVSYKPRPLPADRAVIRFSGGFLLHNNDYNPGFRAVIKEFASRWQRLHVPVWVHLLLEEINSAERMLSHLEMCEGVTAVEISLPYEWEGEEKIALLRSLHCELPVILHVPLNEVMAEWVKDAAGLGFSAVTIGAPRGALEIQRGNVLSGRIFGPALFPLTLQALLHLQIMGIPLIAGSGLYSRRDAGIALTHGAAAIQLDAILWHGGIF